MSASNKIIQATAGNIAAGGAEPVGIDFDGTNDYLSRSSDLVGATDGKTFTFSAWVYISGSASDQRIYHSDDGTGWPRFSVLINSGASVTFVSYPTDGTARLNITSAANSLSKNTWHHILASVDMASQANSKIYINDENVTFNVSTFTNTDLSFSNTAHKIGAETSSAGLVEGRLAGVYLDYTYRDLSVESNRRDFIDADGLYVTPPTSGIISVPMDDPADPGRNDGTGGNFTLNGIIAQSGRGPNQYNAAASTFDGSADYLSRTSLTGIADGKQGTFSCSFKTNTFGNRPFISFVQSGNQRFVIRTSNAGSYGYLTIIAQNSSGTNILQMADPSVIRFTLNKMHSLQVSFDLTDSNKRHIFVDGVEQTGLTYAAYTNDNIDYVVSDGYAVGATPIPNFYYPGEISDLYFDTTYIDLSTENPFYDTETGKPKFLGASGELPTGSAPLIYLPLYANDAGNNLGTGGDFTVNSGPYTGARGPSEYWASSAGFGGSASNYLSKSSLTGASDGTVFSVALAMYRNTETGTQRLVEFIDGSTYRVGVHANASSFELVTRNSSGTQEALIQTSTTSLQPSQWYILLACFDTANSNNCKVYVYYDQVPNGQNQSFGAYGGFAGNNASFTSAVTINTNTSNSINGAIGQVYFDNRYIDFSQESNRLKFVDAFGYMKDLSVEIENENIDSPLIYVPFSNASNFGQNLGTGGDFTVNGTVNNFGYVDINA